jgi:hypothetical protein
MTAPGAYEDLGGGVTDLPPRKPATATPDAPRQHRWQLIAGEFSTSKHRCIHCGVIRTRITHTDRFPTTRYLTRDGQTLDRAPPCHR